MKTGITPTPTSKVNLLRGNMREFVTPESKTNEERAEEQKQAVKTINDLHIEEKRLYRRQLDVQRKIGDILIIEKSNHSMDNGDSGLLKIYHLVFIRLQNI